MGLTITLAGSKVRSNKPSKVKARMPGTKPIVEDKYAYLATQVHNLSNVSQSLQVDVQYANKTLDKLVLIVDKQGELAHEINRHGDSFKRVFEYLEELTKEIRADREKAEKVAETVVGHKSGLRATTWALSTIGVLVVIIWSMFTAQILREQDRTNLDVTEVNNSLERRKIAADLRIDGLQAQIQELRLNMRQDRANGARRENSQ